MTPFEIAALLGAVMGCASLGYLIIKSIRDKPRLIFEEGLKIFYPAEGNNFFTTIIIRMKVHNRGTKSTTIHYSKLTFNYNSERREIEDNRNFEILPDSTVDYYPNTNLHKDDLVIHDKITNCVLTIKHTHGTTVLNLGAIEENKKWVIDLGIKIKRTHNICERCEEDVSKENLLRIYNVEVKLCDKCCDSLK